MADEYPLPSYPTLRAHHNPEWGQRGEYLWTMAADGEEAGTKLPCIVHHPDISSDGTTPGHTADEKYWNVSVTIVWPPNGLHPGKVLRKAGIFWKEGEFAGYVTEDPCGPPFPG